jgi:uncharacterized lipoprotein YddW (UPF0748 family)
MKPFPQSNYILVLIFGVLLAGILLFTSTCVHIPTQESTASQGEVRAMWVSDLASGLRSPEEITQMVDAVRRAHLNTIIAQVRREGSVLFKSNLEPRHVLIKEQPDFDPLAVLLKEAHDTSGGRARLDVYAWFNVFKIGSQKDLMDAKPAPISIAHPDWFTRNAKGEVQTDVEPGLAEVQDHTIAVIEECLQHYDVDGINLDYIRYFGKEMGYHPLVLQRFRRLTDRTDIPAPEDQQWSDFRRDQVTAFVRRCAISVWTYRPNAMFSVDAVGFGRPPLKHFSDTSPYITVFQDWAGWARQGYVDVVCRMGYKRERVPLQAEHFRGWADYSKKLQQQSSGRFVTIGVGGYSNPQEAVLTQYREALKRGLGTSLFSYDRPTLEASETGPHGFASPLWDALGREIYREYVAPPGPEWRSQRAAIAGFLKDASGKVLDGGDVALSGGTKHRTTSDGSGFFAFVDLTPGTYRLHAPGTAIDGVIVHCSPGKVSWVR